MADLSSIFSSLFKKNKSAAGSSQASTESGNAPAESATASAPRVSSLAAPLPFGEAEIRTLPPAHLEELVNRQPERTILRILGTITDAALQVRMVQAIGEESVLKRISRSELDKKIRRAADKKLRERSSSGMDQCLQKLAPLNEEMRAFVAKPRWDELSSLLNRVQAPDCLPETHGTAGAIPSAIDENNAFLVDFRSLRERLRREGETYRRTCDEMISICAQLDPSRFLPQSEMQKLKDRWAELREKYAFPKDFETLERYEEVLASRRQPRKATTPALGAKSIDPDKVPAQEIDSETENENEPIDLSAEAARTQERFAQSQARDQARDRARAERESKEASDRQARVAALDAIWVRLREAEANLAQRQAGPALRELQSETAALRRWRRDFPAQLDEAELLIKNLLSKRTEVVDDARWDAWARTDLAKRIQTELEQIISGLENEADAETALKKSVGLTARLHEYAAEMRALGSLERNKDHKIWQQFKSLSDRGWAVCERMRGLVLERVKTILSEHATKPIDYTAQSLTQSRQPVTFKTSAFAGEVPDHLKALRVLWLEIGTKSSATNRELETVFTKLFEAYFRQLNLQQGQVLRAENTAIQRKRDLLKEMKIAAEGKSTLVSRAQVGQRLAEKWPQVPMPDSVAAELQSEFADYQARLNAELDSELSADRDRLLEIATRAQTVLDKIQAKTGASIAEALRAITGLEAEVRAIEGHQVRLVPLRQNVASPAESSASATQSYAEAQARVQAALNSGKTAAQREIGERAEERDRVLREATELALSEDWEPAKTRFEELAALWKKAGALGQSQDAGFGLLFDNMHAFFRARWEARARLETPDQAAKRLKSRNEVIYSLEALTRMNEPKKGRAAPHLLPLPFAEGELRANSSGKLLEAGMRYRQILALDPAQGVTKETRKLMEQWTKLGLTGDESAAACWDYYVNRVRALLDLG